MTPPDDQSADPAVEHSHANCNEALEELLRSQRTERLGRYRRVATVVVEPGHRTAEDVAGEIATRLDPTDGQLQVRVRNMLAQNTMSQGGFDEAGAEGGFRRNAFSYLLTLRLIPIVPFWLVNLAPAFFGVPLTTFVVTTVLGIIPGTIVYVGVGNGLGATLDAGEDPDLGIILDPEILLPLLGLAVLSLLPLAYRHWRGRSRAAAP